MRPLLSYSSSNSIFSFNIRFVIVALILSTFLTSETAGQIQFPGRCPPVTPQANFNLNRYLGKWLQIRGYPAFFQSDGSCVKAKYSLLANGSVLVKNSQIRFGVPNSIEGNALQVEPGKFIVNFPSSPLPPPVSPNYIVLGTDYKNFAVVFSCTPNANGNVQIAWVLARKPKITYKDEKKISRILRKNNISKKPFIETSQIGCSA